MTTQLQPTQSFLDAGQPTVATSTPQSRRLVFGVIGSVLIISGLAYLAFTL
jgi:hypothetical protein